MIAVRDDHGREWRYPTVEAFAATATSPDRPWTGCVTIRPSQPKRWPRKQVK